MESSVVFAPSELVKNIPIGGLFATLDEDFSGLFLQSSIKIF